MPEYIYSPLFPHLFWEIYDRWISPGVVPALNADLHDRLIPTVAPGAHLLDVGSGGGQHAVRIVMDRPDLRVTGIDIEPVMVTRSRRLARSAGVGNRAEFLEGNALELPFEDASFDHVYCAGPVKQVSQKIRVFNECLRVLKPSGRLLVMDVDRGCRVEDVDAMCHLTPLNRVLKALLRRYFLGWVAATSIDLDELREIWAPLRLLDCDGPRRIDGFPALIAVGTKP